MKPTFKYWARTAAGIESIFLEELKEKFKVIESSINHKSVFFDLGENINNEENLSILLSTADDIYSFIGYCTGINNTKASTKNIINYFNTTILPKIRTQLASKLVRITVSFLGTRNYNRFYIENSLNRILELERDVSVLSNENKEKWKRGEKRIRIHIENDVAYFGIGLEDKPLHRRQWRVNSYPAQLHPPTAAAMIRLGRAFRGIKLIDPFCGSGTILIEAALQNLAPEYIGFDISKTAIDIAQENSTSAKVNISFRNEDFFNSYNKLSKYFIITNPPWGEKHSLNPKEVDLFFQNILKLIDHSVGGLIIVPSNLITKFNSTKHLVSEMFQTRVRGILASVILIKKL